MVIAPAFIVLICMFLGIFFCLLLVLAIRCWNRFENSDWEAQEGQSGLYTADRNFSIPWLKLYASDTFHMVDRLVPSTSLLKAALVPGRASTRGSRQMVDEGIPQTAILCPELVVPAGCECVVVMPQSNVGALAGSGVNIKMQNLRGHHMLRVCVEQCAVDEEAARCDCLGRRRLRLCSCDSDEALAFFEEVSSHPPAYEVRNADGGYFASIDVGEPPEGIEKMYVASSKEGPWLLNLSGDTIMSSVRVTDADRECFCKSKCKKGHRFLEVSAGIDVGLLVLLFLGVELLERRDGARGPARGAFDLDSVGKACPGCGVPYAERDVCCVRCGLQRDLSRGMSASSALADLVGLGPRSVILEISDNVEGVNDFDREGPNRPIANRRGSALCKGIWCAGCGEIFAEGSVCCARCGRQGEVSFSTSAKSPGMAAPRLAKTERNGWSGQNVDGRDQLDNISALVDPAEIVKRLEQSIAEAKGSAFGGQKADGRSITVTSTALDELVSPRPQSGTSGTSTELEERSTSESGSGHSFAASVEAAEFMSPRERWQSGASCDSLGLAELQVPPPRWPTEGFNEFEV